MEMSKKTKTIAVSISVALVMVMIGIISGDIGVMGNMTLIAVVTIVLPFFIYRYTRFAWIRSLESQFPGFIRDLSDARRSGMSFSESMKISSKGNYGKLTGEIIRMHNKLSWGVPFIRVLEMFRERVKESKLITESITIIKESYKAGGDIASTLESISRDMVMLKEAESERSSIVKQHVMIMYGIFFMFVGISIMIILFMVPMVQDQPQVQTGSFGFSFTNPCEGMSFFPCNVFSVVGFMLGVPGGIGSYYVSLFFIVMVVQGIFTGLIAGQLGENSVIAGMKHSMIMTFSGIGIFIFIIKAGFLPI